MADQKCTPESLFELRWVSDPQLAPDERRVAFVEHWVEDATRDGKTRKAYRTAIMLSTDGDATPRRLTYSLSGNDSAPRWSPDGQQLAFVSTRDGDKPQLFVLDLDGGEAAQVTRAADLSDGIGEYAWHPSGQLFCFTASAHQDEERRRWLEQHDEMVYENRLPFKFDSAGMLDERRAQLYRIARDGSDCVRLTDLDRTVESPAWSPDGRRIAFVSQNLETRETIWAADLFVVGIGGDELRQLTATAGPVEQPAWSPDGSQIVFLGHDRHLGNATATKLWSISADGGAPRCLTPDFAGEVGGVPTGDARLGRHPAAPAWDSAGRIVFTGEIYGRSGLYRVADTGVVEQINTSGLSVVGFSLRGAAIAFTGETSSRTAEIYTAHDGHGITRRSHAGDAFFAAYAIRPPEHVLFRGAEDWELEGWAIRPEGEGKHPLIVYVHGGPHLAYGNAFVHEFQVLAAAGFGIFFANPRGSSSYGEEFADAVRKHFGENDFADIMAAADVAAGWDWVDPARMGIMGGSYGGYMTNWTITHTDRFAAACTQRSISNLVSFAGTSDIGPEFSRDEYGGLPWTDEETLMSKSPIRYVASCKTPTLILHQENDHRCPIEQGEQLYTALVELDVPVKFVRFPDECHELPRAGQPQRRVNRMGHIVDWFGRYLR